MKLDKLNSQSYSDSGDTKKTEIKMITIKRDKNGNVRNETEKKNLELIQRDVTKIKFD